MPTETRWYLVADVPNEDARRKAEEQAAQFFSQVEEPSTMTEAFVSMHEMYLALRASGFNEYQALWLIGYLICGGSGKGVDDDKNGNN